MELSWLFEFVHFLAVRTSLLLHGIWSFSLHVVREARVCRAVCLKRNAHLDRLNLTLVHHLARLHHLVRLHHLARLHHLVRLHHLARLRHDHLLLLAIHLLLVWRNHHHRPVSVSRLHLLHACWLHHLGSHGLLVFLLFLFLLLLLVRFLLLLFPAVVDDLEADQRDWGVNDGADDDKYDQANSECTLIVFNSLSTSSVIPREFAQVDDKDQDNVQNPGDD